MIFVKTILKELFFFLLEKKEILFEYPLLIDKKDLEHKASVPCVIYSTRKYRTIPYLSINTYNKRTFPLKFEKYKLHHSFNIVFPTYEQCLNTNIIDQSESNLINAMQKIIKDAVLQVLYQSLVVNFEPIYKSKKKANCTIQFNKKRVVEKSLVLFWLGKPIIFSGLNVFLRRIITREIKNLVKDESNFSNSLISLIPIKSKPKENYFVQCELEKGKLYTVMPRLYFELCMKYNKFKKINVLFSFTQDLYYKNNKEYSPSPKEMKLFKSFLSRSGKNYIDPFLKVLHIYFSVAKKIKNCKFFINNEQLKYSFVKKVLFRILSNSLSSCSNFSEDKELSPRTNFAIYQLVRNICKVLV